MRVRQSLWERYWNKVEPGNVVPWSLNLDRCWDWTGYIDRDGYGRIDYDGRTYGVHRLSYRWFVGPIPKWLQLDHLCRNRACVNPAHLEAVTCGINIRRGDTGRWAREYQPRLTFPRARRAQGRQLPLPLVWIRPNHCPHGHAFTPDNTIIRHSEGGARRCKTCQYARVEDWKRPSSGRHTTRRELTPRNVSTKAAHTGQGCHGP